MMRLGKFRVSIETEFLVFSPNRIQRTLLLDQWKPQFKKVDPISTTAYGMPYDYVSVMHYSKSVGALSNGMITIETTNKAFQVFTFIRNENFLVKCG